MYKTSLIALATIASGVVAQTTTTLFLAGFDDSQALVGSVIGSDASATTYSITCASESDVATDIGCEVPDSFTFTQGPSTINYLYTISDSDDGSVETAGLGCNLSGSSSAACSASYLLMNGTSTVSNYATTTTISADLADMTSGLGGVAVTITAGAAASTTNTAASTTMSSSSTGSSSSAKNTGKGSTTSGTSTGASQTAATGTATSSLSTGGVPMMTGNAKWVVGGVAAVGLVFGL